MPVLYIAITGFAVLKYGIYSMANQFDSSGQAAASKQHCIRAGSDSSLARY
jgi:hypothetical protein